MTVRLAHANAELTPGRLTYGNADAVTDRRWATAPVWFLVSDEREDSSTVPFLKGTVDDGSSPYVVPKNLGVNELISRLGDTDGDPDTPNFAASWGHAPRPTRGTVTFRDGNVIALGVTG
jgi:hypothetical protein